MTRKTVQPDEVAEALAMREAGYTTLSISQRTGLSVRSLHRHFAAHGVKKGAVKQELLDHARAELLDRVTSDDAIREEAARLINDDIAHSRHLRALMLEASDKLRASSLADAALVMRAAAAYSTAIKNTSDVLRHSLRVEQSLDDMNLDLPELVVRELTEAEVQELRATDVHQVMALERPGDGAAEKDEVLEEMDPLDGGVE